MPLPFRTLCAFAMAMVVGSVATPTSTECSRGDDDNDDVEKFGTEFLQQQRQLPPRSFQTLLPTPIWWLHVPRTGASFAYTLLGMDALCPGYTTPATRDLKEITVEFVRQRCPGISVDGRCGKTTNYGVCAETSIGGFMHERAMAKVVGFFRQPEVRLLSDYHQGNRGEDIADWASEYLGCHTKKLTYDGDGATDDNWHCKGPPPTWEEVELAKQRVQTDYIFIGMTDDWDLSICLFNVKFGNKCSAGQFQNYGGHTTQGYDLSELNGVVDPYDAELFQAARRIFLDDLRRFNVSEETCQPCPDEHTSQKSVTPPQ